MIVMVCGIVRLIVREAPRQPMRRAIFVAVPRASIVLEQIHDAMRATIRVIHVIRVFVLSSGHLVAMLMLCASVRVVRIVLSSVRTAMTITVMVRVGIHAARPGGVIKVCANQR